jgi:hypothetical protein
MKSPLESSSSLVLPLEGSIASLRIGLEKNGVDKD